jgi:sulfite reductase alpha subunit-like flavoprotein
VTAGVVVFRNDDDYIYQEEFEAYLERGTLTGLHVAFSRRQATKVYVQVRRL